MPKPDPLSGDGSSLRYGSKNIGFFSSYCLTVNNIMGPAMVAYPYLTQYAGWFSVLMMTIICCICSGMSSAMLCEALQRIPGNFYFNGINPRTGQRYEFCDAVQFYWGERVAAVVRVFFNISLQAQNIPAMVVSCQVMDDFFVHILGWCTQIRYDRMPPVVGHCEQASTWSISISPLVVMVVCIPFGVLPLEQNKHFQNVSFVCLMVLVAEFLLQFCYIGPVAGGQPLVLARTPWVTANQAKTLGVVLFSWCFPSTLPSWVNEKQPRVNVNRVVWSSCFTSLVLKLGVGLFGAWAYAMSTATDPAVKADKQNILLVMNDMSPQWVTQASTYLFNVTTLIPGIPVVAVIVRYNLLSSGRVGACGASFLGVVLPWLVTVILYHAGVFVDVLNWAAMLCMGPVNFVIPPLLFLSAVKRFPASTPSRDGAREALLREMPTFVFSGESAEDEVVSSQISIVAVPASFQRVVPRTSVAHVTAGVMATLVVATILLNIIYILIFGQDLVD